MHNMQPPTTHLKIISRRKAFNGYKTSTHTHTHIYETFSVYNSSASKSTVLHILPRFNVHN